MDDISYQNSNMSGLEGIKTPKPKRSKIDISVSNVDS